MSSRKNQKEEDPVLVLKRKFQAKCRFRALGRLVMANSYWMLADSVKYEGDDVKRRVEEAVRSKAKAQLLSLNDKTLLNKPADDRTVSEKHYLYRILGGLKCFKKYPVAVKRKLTAVTYFRYYGPGRVIVRQDQDAHALYFIVTGEVIVSQMSWDELLQTDCSVNICTLYPGDLFGEVSLLHNIKRTATCTSNAHCELLAVLKQDFKAVLQDTVQKQWDEILRAMSRFSYFSTLDEVSLREGCIVAKLKTYEKDEVILGDGAGIANFVYFVLEGRCQMIESLQMFIKNRLGRNYFTLFDPYIEDPFLHCFLKDRQNVQTNFRIYNFSKNKDFFKDYSITLRKILPNKWQDSDDEDEDIDLKYFMKTRESGSKSNEPPKKPRSSKEIRRHRFSTVSGISGYSEVRSDFMKHSFRSIDSHHAISASDFKFSSSHVIYSNTERKTSSREEEEFERLNEGAGDLHTFFMQVCQMIPGASFGCGENMRDRRVIALTPVTCLLLPKIWLLQKNTANIWTRIQHYLTKKIPNKKALFKEFVSSCRWQEFKDQQVEDVISRSSAVNATSIHDVPMSIRMDEVVEL